MDSILSHAFFLTATAMLVVALRSRYRTKFSVTRLAVLGWVQGAMGITLIAAGTNEILYDGRTEPHVMLVVAGTTYIGAGILFLYAKHARKRLRSQYPDGIGEARA